MSYYSHPFFSLSTTPTPSPSPFAAQPRRRAYGYGQTFDDLYHDNALLTLEEEEAAALAHLRSVQHRRAQAQAQARVQAEAEARARQQREAAIVRAEIARLAAQQEAEQRRRQREQLIQARAQAQAQARAHALALQAQARAHAHAQAQAVRERVQVQAQRARAQAQACAARHTRNAQSYIQNPEDNLGALLASLFGINLNPEAENESSVPASAPAPVQPAAPAQQTPTETRAVAPATGQVPQAAATASTSTTAPATEDEATFPEDINALLSQFLGLRVEPTSESAPATTNESQAESSSTPKNVVPQGLNEFLSRFGLVFEPEEPAAAAESSTSVPGPTTEQPTTASAATSSTVPPAADSAPAPAPAKESPTNTAATSNNNPTDVPPITALFEQYAELNPLMRDIFGNLEHAFTNEYHRKRSGRPSAAACQKKYAKAECAKDKGKGKEVAEGEKNAITTSTSTSTSAPAPTTASPVPALTSAPVAAPVESTPESETISTASSLSALDLIKEQLSSLQSSFTFPPQLAFAHTDPGVAAPPLLFNRTNSSYHAQTHALLQLLLQADEISSGGDKEVRQKRKALVRSVEKEIEQLEKKRDDQWELVKERRERGEETEHEDDGRSSSWSDVSSNAEHEHIEDVNKEYQVEAEVDAEVPVVEEEGKVEAEHKSYADVAKLESSAQDAFDVPAPAEPSQATATEAVEVDVNAKEHSDEGKPEPKNEESYSTEEVKENKENDKEEGYEML